MRERKLASYKHYLCGLLTVCLLFSMIPLLSSSAYAAALPTEISASTSLQQQTDQKLTSAAELLEYEAQMAFMAALHAWPALDKLWPGTQYQSRLILLTNGEQTYEITTSGYKLVEPSNPGLPLELYFDSQYKALDWNGKKAVAIFVDKDKPLQDRFEPHTSTPISFIIATHEMFHFYDQPSWPIVQDPNKNYSRSSIYPAEVKPRIQRAMLFQALYQAYTDPEATPMHLGHAAYWYQQYKQDNPTEYENSLYYDTIEGIASYIDKMSVMYNALEGSASAQQIRDFFTKQYQDINMNGFITFDQESYLIGSWSAFLLDALNKDWKGLMTEGHTPIEQLLEGVTPIPQQADDKIIAEREATIAQFNTDLAITLDPLKKALDDPNIPLLLIPPDIKRGAFGTTGFITLKGYEPGYVIMKMSTQFSTSAGKLELKERSMLRMLTYNETKKGDYLITPLQADEYVRTDGTLTFDKNGLKGTVYVKPFKYNGREAYMVAP